MIDPDISRIARDWPGKSQPDIHPALWHMLDVGSVASALLAYRPVAGGETDQALALLAALHDLGKISASFRAMLRDGGPQQRRHWEHSAALFVQHDDLLAALIGGDDSVRHTLYEAAAGHHGGPRERLMPDKLAQQMREIGEPAIHDARLAIGAIADLFPAASLKDVNDAQAAILSWHLNGLVVQSDWIGSNPDWFVPKDPNIGIREYWKTAQQCATAAISSAGLHQAQPAEEGHAAILPSGVTPRPMQRTAQTTPLPPGPVLAVIEDATGAGKTEAALILAARMMQDGKADGLFFALPTMATANAMLSRLEAATPALFDGAPTLGLGHGRAHLSAAFQRLRGKDGSNPEAGPHCGAWLADDRRRILLSDIGVGTIDQALFAVLPTRFNGLRLRALSRKVLIVDEAHSYDPYMQAQLERLLTFQARLGGSAIVMTATLPGEMKQQLVSAYQSGLKPPRPSRGRRGKPPRALAGPYPALTMVAGQTELTAVNPALPTIRRVAVDRLSSADDAAALIHNAAGQGGACIWIRNAVDDAIAAVSQLRGLGIRADLLHARFALCDRLQKEAALQVRFGRNGQGRAGRVLVATQVAEQSLDLDFDVMVSDLAPIGALIQRAGRLWRHMDERPAQARPVDGPRLQVLSPDPGRVPNDSWVRQVLDRGAYVYPHADLWRSAKALFDVGEIAAPDGLRGLIEAVHGADPLPLPAALETASFAQEGKEIVERQLARNCLISATQPFDQDAMGKIWDDEKFPTRLGVPQVTLALARQGAERLEPYALGGIDRWTLSEVQVSAVRFARLTPPDQSTPEIQAIRQGWSAARAAHTIVAPLGEDGRICEGLRYDAELGLVWA